MRSFVTLFKNMCIRFNFVLNKLFYGERKSNLLVFPVCSILRETFLKKEAWGITLKCCYTWQRIRERLKMIKKLFGVTRSKVFIVKSFFIFRSLFKTFYCAINTSFSRNCSSTKNRLIGSRIPFPHSFEALYASYFFKIFRLFSF